MTDKLYEKDSYVKSFTASVVKCEKAENGYRVILDKTAFFPTEGGQYHDNGTVNGIKVLDVTLEKGEVIHLLPEKISGECLCEIDFDERFDKMQQHTGEHILCGIIHKEYGFDNVGFHLGPDDVTFDMSGMLSTDQLFEIEKKANQAVFQNRDIKAYYPDNPAELEYRSKLELDSNIRIVEIDGVDKCACCAPHVKSTGEVGYIKITDSYSYKGGVRIHLACGLRAIEYAQAEHRNLLEIAKVLSSSTTNAAEFFKKYVGDVNALKKTLGDTKKELISLKAEFIEKAESIVLFEDVEPALLRPFVNSLSEKYSDLCAVFSGDDQKGYNYVIASKDNDLREFIKGFNQKLSGKGGGAPLMVQGSVRATREQITEYLNKG